MSKSDGAKIVNEKEVNLAPGSHGDGKQSILEELTERREAVEAEREKREKPRSDYMKTGQGKASDHFELVTNRQTVERYTDQTGAPQTAEELSESAREKWLRTGELPEKKANGKAAKKEEQAAETPTQPERPKLADFRDETNGQIDNDRYEAALDKYETDKTAFEKQQAEPKNEEPKLTQEQITQLDREILGEVEKESETWHTEPAHAEAMKTFPQRWQAMETSLTPEQKATVEFSRKALGQTISPELNRFVLNALARVKNMGAVYVELLREPALLWRMNHDWAQSANCKNDPAALKLRICTDKVIRLMLKQFDRRAGAASGSGAKPNGAEREPVRTLTRAGKPPSEASGASSSPADDGSADAAWRRKDLKPEERGELYRTRKNEEESAARRKRHPRRAR